MEELLLDESTDGGELLDSELLQLTLECELTDIDKEDEELDALSWLDELLEEVFLSMCIIDARMSS